MNRNQRIIVSIIGIIIVTLALIGITYAYFLTKIIGNSSTTSVSGNLANLELTYTDGNGVITNDNMIPGTSLTPKTFKVKNTGTTDVDDYAVIFEKVSNNLTRKSDLVYTLECDSDDEIPCDGIENMTFPSSPGTIVKNSIAVGTTHTYTLTVTYKNLDDVNQSDDMGKAFSAKVNIKDGKDLGVPIKTMVLANTKNAKNGTQYRDNPLTKPAVETSVDSSQYVDKDFGEYSFPVQNFTVNYANSYTTDTSNSYGFELTSSSSGNYNSVYSSLKGKFITFYSTSTNEVFEVVEATSSNLTLKRHRLVEKSKESTLSKIEDVYGTSYYYRGDVTDNYLTFNNMCWKIVRIQGDGSTKIVLQDPKAPCSEDTNEEYPFIDRGTWGYKKGTINYENDYLNCGADSSTCMKNKFDSWFNSKFTSVKDKLKEETWYLGDTTNRYEKSSSSYYEAGQRLNGYGTTRGVSLLSKINGFTSYIGALTADEVALAGAMTYEGSNYNNQNYYLLVPAEYYWTLSLDCRYGSYDDAFYVCSNNGGSYAYLNYINVVSTYPGLRPAVVLSSDVSITGEGTKSNPYVVM